MTQSTTYQWHVWIPSLALEGTLMLLTACKIIAYRDGMNRTITVLARDSLLYFVIAFAGLALSVANSVHPIKALNFPVIPPTQCIISIAVGRMVMNIRGLILDDPDRTVYLQSLEFEHSRTYGSEVGLMGSTR
ncbi:hypothetical protein PILCRDRAFT_814221 [Piloderma croceum F 1598]|uniref:Uncharacterized protein n=1 Tax=Piloderma croceum (strain F 1598) TaxID=765440 RepID=A0A0C3G987_PILCF|nr:hypothetical protein PILCRDRAFT_814221 [Piloderma croceum F 1598]